MPFLYEELPHAELEPKTDGKKALMEEISMMMKEAPNEKSAPFCRHAQIVFIW